MSIGGGSDCSLERTYEILSHPTRRSLLRRLRNVETTTVRTAADNLAEAERIEKAERGEVMLHHVHLPKMSDAGIIDYDPDTGTIRTNETTDAICDVLNGVSSAYDEP
ncbi:MULTISPECIES: DUF7344 domain-containing protein [Natrialbaceae]|uniref:DUF7344 domain-containing protein n=1 Tax=Natrialbaceae TaxID=1644061 RepID=UPI00207CAC87|nr:hypothetical protein [Natronococcus sp. CG52]